MQCIISKIEIHNFMSFADDVINFSSKPGITSIIGVNNDIPGAANGAGKSSGPLALFYCLYGKSAIKTKNKFLKNKYTDGNDFYVTTTLSIDNTTFQIHRGADNASNSFLKLHKLVDDSYVDITPSSIAECEAMIINMLNGLSADIFLKTVYLTPALGTNFFTLSVANKTAFLNLVSGTNKLYDINGKISKDISEINTNVRIIDSELMTLNKTNSTLLAKKEEYIKQQQEAIQAYNDNSANLQMSISVLEGKIQTLNASIIDVKQLMEEYNVENNNLANKLQTIKINIGKLEAARRALNAKDKHIDEFIIKNQTLCDTVCDDCLPNVKEVLNIPVMLATKANNIELNAQLDKATTQCNDAFATASTAKEKLLVKITENTTKYNELVSTKNKLERDLDANVCKLQLIKDKHNEVAHEVFSGMIEANNVVIEEKQQLKANIINKRQQLSILKFATDSDTVRKFVTSRFVNDINHYVSKYLNDMGVNYYCQFDNDFTYTFMTPGGEMTYDNFSSGEKMRLNIAMSFAFRKLLMTYLNIDVNVIILDEYLDSNLDTLAISGITTLLTEIKQNPFYNIFLISHRKEFLSGSIDNIMTVTKTNGISKISYDNDGQHV